MPADQRTKSPVPGAATIPGTWWKGFKLREAPEQEESRLRGAARE